MQLSLSIIATSTSVQGPLESLSHAILYHYQQGKLHLHVFQQRCLDSSQGIINKRSFNKHSTASEIHVGATFLVDNDTGLLVTGFPETLECLYL